MAPIRVAVDIGGTFTDLQLIDEASGACWAFKTPTTPADPSEGLLNGLRGAAERFGFSLGDIGLILHGTTIATNAVLERKLAMGALLTTAGFRDVLEIGRHLRKDIYGLRAEPRSLLIPRQHRFDVTERVRADGSVETPLDEAEVRALARRLLEAEIEAVAVCYLHAYRSFAHERRTAEILAEEAPGIRVSLSHRVSPEMREFERTSTTVLNALLMPVVGAYLDRIEKRLAEAGVGALLYLVQSNGGVTTPAVAAEQPARLLLSGPSGGAMALQQLSAQMGEPNLVGLDMGGTSTDVAVVRDGQITLVTEGTIDDLPVRLPMIEIRTIGAGGGSLGRLDTGGGLRVGPESAGAVPGPACYGRGGDRPTVTDANAVRGVFDPDFFLGGAMHLHLERAESALDTLAAALRLDRSRTAAGMVQIANASMASAVRLSLFEKGADPRDFALVPFGGAAGLHAIGVAEELDMRRVLFPTDPATLSARGILFADIAHDLAETRLQPGLAESLPALREMADRLRAAGEAVLARDGVPETQRHLELAADMRYRGQAYELLIPWEGEVDESGLANAVAAFHAMHLERFAHQDLEEVPEIVTLRLTARGLLPKAQAEGLSASATGGPKGQRTVDAAAVPVYAREALGTLPLAGPMIVEEPYTTLWLPAGWHIRAVGAGHLLAEKA
ncbi:MAG TPA: hydantoinase/oxoprolinase family protein [Alphaproteobacteria bacterium]|nr:hydantoinase/oxoprolinase family protein [Alphaproteobacteria bacterium]